MNFRCASLLCVISFIGIIISGCSNAIQVPTTMPETCSSCPSTIPAKSESEEPREEAKVNLSPTEVKPLCEQQVDSSSIETSATGLCGSRNVDNGKVSPSNSSEHQNNTQTNQHHLKKSVDKIKALAKEANKKAQAAAKQNTLAKTNASKAQANAQQAFQSALKGDGHSAMKYTQNAIQASQAAHQASLNAKQLAREAWRKADQADQINQMIQESSIKGQFESSSSSAKLAANQALNSAQQAQTQSDQADDWAAQAEEYTRQINNTQAVVQAAESLKELAGKAKTALKEITKNKKQSDLDNGSKIADQRKASDPKKSSVERNRKKLPSDGNVYGRINPMDIPELPPVPNLRPLPEGVVAPVSPTEKKEVILGMWKQVEGSNKSDFLPGGYEQSTLIFHADGILEICRSFGQNQEVLLTWKIGYEWNEANSQLVLGKDPNFRPSLDSLRGFTMEKLNLSVESAVRSLPVMLQLHFLEDNQIQVDGKRYREMSN